MRIYMSGGHSRHGLRFIVGGLALIATPAFAEQGSLPPPPPPSTIAISSAPGTKGNVWVGADAEPGSVAVAIGTTFALNGNLNTDGALLRASAAYGGYESGPAINPRVHFGTGSLLIGYQTHLGKVFVSGFVGPQVIHNGEGADPNVRGTSWAALVTGEIVVPAGNMELSSWGSYSTFENQYYVQGRVLYRASPKFKIGPQAALLGGNTWRSGRAGGYFQMATSFGAFEGGLGYTWDRDGSNHEGVYGGGSLTFRF